MEGLREVEFQLNDLGCPLCSGRKFSLRESKGSGGISASCLRCSTVLEIDREDTLLRLPAPARKDLKKLCCIHCGSHFTRVSLRCEIDTFTQFFVALCTDCSRTFAFSALQQDPSLPTIKLLS